MSEKLKLKFGELELELREPKHGEYDLALITRLFEQVGVHKADMDAVQGGEGSAMKWDALLLKLTDCIYEIAKRTRACVLVCVETIDGKDPSGSEIVEAFPEIDDRSVFDWEGVYRGLFSQLLERTALGK